MAAKAAIFSSIQHSLKAQKEALPPPFIPTSPPQPLVVINNDKIIDTNSADFKLDLFIEMLLIVIF
jgi:hypothetical protein